MKYVEVNVNKRLRLIWLMVYGLIVIISVHWLWQYSYQELQVKSSQQLAQFNRHLESQLGHYSYIPQLISRQGIMIRTLQLSDNSAQIDLTNHHLSSINNIIGASVTYLLDTEGKTIASSNWSTPDSFIGSNFSFRPYFKQAMQNDNGEYFALGSMSGKRGYYFSYPVRYAAEVIGVIVVKMDLSSIEKDWADKKEIFSVTDSNNIVFISSQKEWLFHSLIKLPKDVLKTVLSSRQYLNRNIQSLKLTGNIDDAPSLIKIKHQYYLSSFTDTHNEYWKIRVFVPITGILFNIAMLILFISLLSVLLYLLFVLIKQRQSRAEEKVLTEAKAKQQLEFTVMQRTSALQAEISERKKAEKALRSAQEELIQSAKLAMLGQLSASISHELNNPLSAIRSYAENAVLFLDRGKHNEVDNNLKRITSLTQRMAKISAQLKSFARKSDGELQIISLQPVIFAANELLKPEFKSNKVELKLILPDEPIMAKAEAIQLEQVIVNLVSNALQSSLSTNNKTITLLLDTDSESAFIRVQDRGTGIEEKHLSLLFEPFFTTKETGLGLGLSISHQIITNMGGLLTACNRSQGGAEFSITLPIVSRLNASLNNKDLQ